ncbi:MULTISPECIES: hypothetical protein [unclassified Rhizobacter]|uniref:hypothetical protein n=1 Tax=unclassified Rhizobacter TaxID=2640088 RepID=UPI0006F346C8|nr:MULTISPECIES: hypothetical protein [unclassified Rhizobacter]KQU78169.1 hypothetical protein ASC88_20325 [Rhizobacter sp. Root29]KQW15915.1 hypothetical protein ASC98_01545 [Rhizobacter sp. Root1238]KRB25030.1 hypothetical protein ASE08_02280 [Rhizobacter sp. Root16D2]
MPAAAVAGAAVIGGIYSAHKQANAAEDAANTQAAASDRGIAEQRRQFDAVRELLQPYVSTGTTALAQQGDLAGLGGIGAQQAAINALQSSPMFTALQQQGESRILANASATGGLRGGNVQGALAQFSPALLNQVITDQYARLGGLSSMGQNAAAGVGNAGMQTGSGISNLLQQQGAALAGGALAGGRAQAGYANAVGSGLGLYGAMGGFSSGRPFTGDTALSNADLAAKYGF